MLYVLSNFIIVRSGFSWTWQLEFRKGLKFSTYCRSATFCALSLKSRKKWSNMIRQTYVSKITSERGGLPNPKLYLKKHWDASADFFILLLGIFLKKGVLDCVLRRWRTGRSHPTEIHTVMRTSMANSGA